MTKDIGVPHRDTFELDRSGLCLTLFEARDGTDSAKARRWFPANVRMLAADQP